jgi:hypothetical protein
MQSRTRSNILYCYGVTFAVSYSYPRNTGRFLYDVEEQHLAAVHLLMVLVPSLEQTVCEKCVM